MTYSEKLKSPKWQKKSGIYKLIISDGEYIGSALYLTKRIRSHYNALIRGNHKNIHLQRAFDKYQNFDFDVLEIVDLKSDLIIREQFYIDTMKPKYNIAHIAGSQLGFKHSDETKLRISQMQIGKVLSSETIERMRISKLGWSPTLEQRKNYSLSKMGDKNPFYKAGKNHPQYGKTKSEITRNRISKTSIERGSHKGVKNSASKKGVLYDAYTGANYLFHSLKPLCEVLGINYGGMCTALRNDKFLLKRFYVTHCYVPHETNQAKLTKLIING